MPSLKGISMFYAKKYREDRRLRTHNIFYFGTNLNSAFIASLGIMLLLAYERLEVTVNETLEEITIRVGMLDMARVVQV